MTCLRSQRREYWLLVLPRDAVASPCVPAYRVTLCHALLRGPVFTQHLLMGYLLGFYNCIQLEQQIGLHSLHSLRPEAVWFVLWAEMYAPQIPTS